MVYESRVGDVFALGATQLADRGHHPRPGAGLPRARPARAAAVLEGRPLGRPAELGAAIGAFIRELGGADRPTQAIARCRDRRASTTWAADNLVAFLDEQREATGTLPHDRTIAGRAVPRRARRLAARRALAVRRARCTRRGRWRSARGCASATASTRRRCPPTTASCCGSPRPTRTRPAPSWCVFEPDEIEEIVTDRGRRLGAVRLPLPRVRGPGAAAAPPRPRPALAAVAAAAAVAPSCSRSPSKYPSFPIVLEAVRECLQDVYDVPGAGRR